MKYEFITDYECITIIPTFGFSVADFDDNEGGGVDVFFMSFLFWTLLVRYKN